MCVMGLAFSHAIDSSQCLQQVSAVYATVVLSLATPLSAVAFSFRWLLASEYEPLTGTCRLQFRF